MHGEVTERQLRVMIAHLPPGSPWYRETEGLFGPSELLLREIESRLREVRVAQESTYNAVKAGLRVRGPSQLPTPKYIPIPGPTWENDAEEHALRAQERAELEVLLHRN